MSVDANRIALGVTKPRVRPKRQTYHYDGMLWTQGQDITTPSRARVGNETWDKME